MVSHEPQPKRRWYQFSLRTLIIFVLICGVVSGRLGQELNETRREQVAVAEIEKLWAFIWYHEMIGPDWITRHFRKVQSVVVISGTQVTDAGLVHLKELTNLESLRFDGTEVTDAWLVHLKGLTNLESLHLESTNITDAGLVHLKDLTNLEWLELGRTQITDAGLVHLKGLSSLEELSLRNTEVTDTGLVHLEGLTNLEGLDLCGTQVTGQGATKLRQALPNCVIAH